MFPGLKFKVCLPRNWKQNVCSTDCPHKNVYGASTTSDINNTNQAAYTGWNIPALSRHETNGKLNYGLETVEIIFSLSRSVSQFMGIGQE